MIYNTYFSAIGLQDALGVLPNYGLLPGMGRLDDLGEYSFAPGSLFRNGEQGVWYDPSDLTPEKVSWRRNLLTYSQDFENAAWTKSNASILSNLALYSQDFNNAWWSTARATISANTSVAPDGTTTAETLVEDTTSGTHPLFTPVLTYTANAFTFSVYVKASGRDKVRIATNGTAFGASPYVNYDLVAVTATGVGGATGSIVDAGNGWYRCIATVTATAGTGDIYFQPLNAAASPSYTGSGAASLLFWGAQIVPGSTAQTYTRSLATAAPIQFSDPLGGTLADKLVENTSLVADHRLVSATTALPLGTTYTSSLYLKAAERTFAAIYVLHVASTNFTVNLTTGAITFQNNNGNVTASATDVGNGWWRVQYTYLVTTSSAAGIYATIAYTSSGTITGTGDGVSGLYVYGAQVEQASTVSAYQRITDFNSDFLAAFPTHALYQESTFATPVTALGQSVGGVIDKRLGGLAALGPNLVTNGTFSNGTTGWTLAVNASVTVEPSFAGKTNVVRTVNNTSSGVTTSQTITGLTAGRSYLVTFDAYSPSPNGLVNVGACYVTETASLRVTPTGEDAWQSRQFIFTASGTSTTLSFNAGTSGAGSVQTGDQALLGNFTLREVPGNHALQATSASRPTLQARSNLFTFSEQFDNAIWTKAQGGVALAPVVTANQAANPLTGQMDADLVVFNLNGGTTASDLSQLAQGPSYPLDVLTFSFYARTSDNTSKVFTIVSTNGTVKTITITGTWERFFVTDTAAPSAASSARLRLRGSEGTASSASIYIWGAQLEQASAATTYQRVTTATDYADVGLPRNLTFDGVDDSLATAGNVDLSGTDKVSLFSGVYKNSDAAQGMAVELTTGGSAGSFYVLGPPSAAFAGYQWRSGGTLLSNVTSPTSYAAPITNVLTGLGNIGTDLATIRINGVEVATGSSDQGTGNYANAVLYIGRRGSISLPFNGRLFQLVIRGAETDSVTVGNAERWVGQLTGVAL